MSKELFHTVNNTNTYASVILPIAVPKPYTYAIPEEFISLVKVGMRVEVQFGKSKLYSALILEIHQRKPENHKPKPILSIIDKEPIVTLNQLQLWKWMASYYACSLGEVMTAALPSSLRLASETRIILNPVFDDNYMGLTDNEFLITEALSIQNELSLEDIRKILNKKTIYPLIKSLLDKKIIYLKEEFKTKYKAKKIACVRLQEPYASNSDLLKKAFELLGRSMRQAEALMAYIQISHKQKFVRKQDIYKLATVDSSVVNAIAKKGIFELYDKEVSRIASYENELIDSQILAAQQVQAIAEIKTAFKEKNVVLLHGVTGSGKTRVYIELIQEALNRKEQVLYLLPEIALTTQITSRIQKIFGDDIAVYHSRLNNNERVEMWNKVLEGKSIILGARSSLFLPFRNLKLIIVDEEHDRSFKQTDPAPRYSGRDTAIYMAHLHQAKVVLGTATPSIESFYNTKLAKYALVEMKERFGGIEMPEVIIVDKRKELKERTMQSHFTSVLIEELKAALARGEQAILFQNRRGYAPVIKCQTCGWAQECTNCDVNLTYHKFSNDLRCHYCGYRTRVPSTCPACGDTKLTQQGFGTEKIEDEIKIYFPEAKVARMDFDTVKGKNSHARIINDFEEKRIDILVGTQMVTKGLDFDNVGIVGVLSADQLLQFPDFRSSERAFQLILQVSGRAGRKKKRGKVIVQTYNTSHPVIKEVLENDYQGFFTRELEERNAFLYPPFLRIIRITLKHKKPRTLNDGASVFASVLKEKLGNRVIGPAVPGIPRVRGYFLLDIMIKLEKDAKRISQAKATIRAASQMMKSVPGCSAIRVNVNVDPY